MGHGPVGPVREDLLDYGVVTVVLLGLDGLERGIGEHGVVAPDAEQLVLALGGLAVEVFDPADDQPGGESLPFLRGEGGVFGLRSEEHTSELQSPYDIVFRLLLE